MDPISTLTTQINLQTLPISITTPPSTSNVTGDTQITSSINQLRSFSTALSEFISHYDELHNQIDFINSSIDSKLLNPNDSGLLETSCDRTFQNPRERVSDPVRSWTREYSSFSHDYDESDVSKTPEAADVSKNPVEIDISNKLEVANNHVQIADVSKDNEEIDESENHVEIDTLNSSFSHNYDESDALEKPEVADVSKDHEEIDICEDPVEIGTLKKPEVANNSVQIDTCARDIDVSENHVESDILNSAFLHDYDELDASKMAEVADVSKDHEEIDVSENHPDIDSLKKPEVADVWMDPEEIEVCVDHVGIYTPKKPEVDNPVEIDICKNQEENAVLKKHEEFDTLMIQEGNVASKKLEETVPETSCDGTIAIVLEQNPNRLALGTPESLEEVRKMKRKIVKDEVHVAKKKTQQLRKALARSAAIISELEKKKKDSSGYFDTLLIQEGHVVLKKLEETVPETSLRASESLEEVRNTKRKDRLMKRAKRRKSLLEKALATSAAIISELEKKKESCSYLKKHEEVDISMVLEETDTSKKPEESFPETSCDKTITMAPEAIVLEQNPNTMAANGKQSNENAGTPKCIEEIVVLVHKKPEQIDICNNPEEIVVSKKLEETIPETSCDRTIAVVLEQNPNELDLGKPESVEEVGKKKKRYRKRRRPFIQFSNNPVIYKLQYSCRNMSSKQLKGYVATHYSEMIDLREEIANALKLATDPAKLVLSCIGRFYKTSSKRISAGRQPLYAERMGSVLILECFVMISSDGVEIAKEDQNKAAKAAVEWRTRMMNEGGPGHTDEVDARGLLLLISGFGIQDDVFTIQDIMDLIRVSNVKGILTALRRSVFLVPKIPEVIDLMVKNNLEIEAVDIANIFGVEDVCHRGNILTPNLLNKIKDIQNTSPLQMNNENVIKPESVEQADILKKPEQIEICKNPEEIVVFEKHEETIPETSCDRTTAIVSEQNPNELDLGKPESLQVRNKKIMVFKLQIKCRNMSAKQLKKHVTRNYSEMIDLREEIASALKLAEDPAKLVLNSIGGFYKSGSKTISGSQPLYAARMASVLILECFVMISSDGVEIAKEDRDYAAKAAVDWRTRMMNEGGPGHTDEVDARGLLLLISGFGIQNHVFTIRDIMDLIRASNVKGILTALRRSAFLVPKIPEVINLMVKNNLEIEAVDIANIFGLEDVCHRRNILTTNLLNKIKDIQNASPLQMNNENVIKSESLEEVDILKNPEETVVLKKPEETDTLMIPEESGTWVKTKKTGVVSVLQNLCQRMSFKKLRRHIVEHISEMNNLRVEIAKALKLAEDPAKLVLNSIGRFYKTSTKSLRVMDSQILYVGRMASVLILECFVMISSDGVEIANEHRDYAAKAAVDWRTRMIDEGGPGHTDEVDARGLLLLISGFGIQDDVFSIEDIIDLIQASNVKGIATSLRQSVFLMPKIQEIIYKMVHNNLEIEGVNIAYMFGLEDAYHPGKILTAYLDNKIKDFQNASPAHMLDAVKQHLIDLKSVKQCLESHNVDPSTLLPEFKINEKIQNLEKEVNEWKLNSQKRKYLENPIHHEAKRACVSHQNTPHQHKPVGHRDINRFNQSPQPSSPVLAQASKTDQPPPENRSDNRPDQSANRGRGRERGHGRGSFGRGRGSFPQTTYAPWAPFVGFWPNPGQAQFSWQQWAATPRCPYPTTTKAPPRAQGVLGPRPAQAYPWPHTNRY